MKCLHSGYCCIYLDVIIVDDPELGPVPDNLKHKPSGKVCQHLAGLGPGQYSCSVHERPWYKETPCAAFTQVEFEESNCRLGNYVLNNVK